MTDPADLITDDDLDSVREMVDAGAGLDIALYEHAAVWESRWTADLRVERDKLAEAARRVVTNADGTNPRHTRARDGGCRDDCIPCGLDALRTALDGPAS